MGSSVYTNHGKALPLLHRPQMSFKLGMSFLDCSILSFLHILLKQGDTHLLHENIVCQSVRPKKPEDDVYMLSLMLEVFFKHYHFKQCLSINLFLGKDISWIVL